MIAKAMLLKDGVVSVITGFLTGVISILLITYNSSNEVFNLIAGTFIFSFSVITLYSYKEENAKNSLIFSLICSTLLSLSYYFSIAFVNNKIADPGIVLAQLSLYIIIPFVQVWIEKGYGKMPYQRLFFNSWNNFFICLISGVLLSGFWLVIFVWVKLFETLNISLFRTIFYHQYFVIISISTVLAIGIYIGRKKAKIVNSLRSIVISLCHILLPIVAIIAILFLLALLFLGTELLFATKSASTIISCLLILLLFFINGIFQDGTTKRPLGRLMEKIANIAILTMPIYSLIASYALYLRVDQYGLTSDRIFGLIVTLILLLYSFAYAYSVIIRSETWLEKVKIINIRLAFIIATILLLLYTPILHPDKYSARNQYNRLVSGKVSAQFFDYNYLKNRSGDYGKYYFNKIENLTEHPELELIKSQLSSLEKQESWQIKQKLQIHNIFNDEAIPEELFLGSEYKNWAYSNCYSFKCYILFLNIDDDKENEALLFNRQYNLNSIMLLEQNSEQKWQYVGTLDSQKSPSLELVKKIILEGNYKTIAPKYKDLQIGDSLWSGGAK